MRGKFLRGVDYSAGNDPSISMRTPSAIGGNSGNEVGSIQGDATKIPNTKFTISPSGGHSHSFPSFTKSREDWKAGGQPEGDFVVRHHTQNVSTADHSHNIVG